MYDKILKMLTDTIKQFSDAPIYLDNVMQSSEPFYFVLSVEESMTDNVGQNVQNKAYNVDIALVDSKKDKQLVKSLTESCGAFFNVLNLDGNELFPEDYQTFKTDGIQHINFNVAFPQLIEWSEKYMAKKKNVSVISVEKPTWFPLTDETGAFPVYGAPITIGTAVSIKPDVTTETTPDYGDSVVQDQYVAFGGAEVTLETNGYQNEVLAEITGGKKLKGGVLRSADDIASDGAFAYRRRKSNGKYRYTIFYKGKFALTSDETSTLEGSSVSYTHPEWTGSFVDVPGLGYMYSVDEDDEGVDLEMIKNWFTEVMDPRKENTTAVTGVTLDQTELNLKVGQTATLTPTITPDNASNKKYQFRSESEAIGTVTPIQGKVTAVGEGTTEIVVTTEDGNFTAKCTLNVTTAD